MSRTARGCASPSLVAQKELLKLFEVARKEDKYGGVRNEGIFSTSSSLRPVSEGASASGLRDALDLKTRFDMLGGQGAEYACESASVVAFHVFGFLGRGLVYTNRRFSIAVGHFASGAVPRGVPVALAGTEVFKPRWSSSRLASSKPRLRRRR